MCDPCRASQEPPSSALMLRLVEELSNRQQLLALWHGVHSSIYNLLVRLHCSAWCCQLGAVCSVAFWVCSFV